MEEILHHMAWTVAFAILGVVTIAVTLYFATHCSPGAIGYFFGLGR